MIRKTIAFTLAETLIVMGIIGIVSALTLPNLNSSTGEKEKVAKVKKIYQNLDDAFGRAQAVYGPFDEWFANDNNKLAQSTRFGERVSEFLKVSKSCATSTGCWSTAQLLELDGTVNSTNYFSDLKSSHYSNFSILADGAALAFQCDFQADIYCRIKVDIDGPNKGKTQYGSDIFDFTINSNIDNNLRPSMPGDSGLTGAFGQNNLTAWVVYNDNLDYLKCADKLNWETKTSCK